MIAYNIWQLADGSVIAHSDRPSAVASACRIYASRGTCGGSAQKIVPTFSPLNFCDLQTDNAEYHKMLYACTPSASREILWSKTFASYKRPLGAYMLT
jgi:hypothetical protein